MQYIAFRFHFNAPLHLSDSREDLTTAEKVLHSDTIYAAIMQIWAKLGKATWIEEYKNAFHLSSAFPFLEIENKIHYFLPALRFPSNSITNKEDTSSKERKKFKKIRYLEIPLYTNLLHGTSIEYALDNTEGEFYFSHPLDAATRTIVKESITTQTIPRIRKGTAEADPEIFYMQKTYFNNAGFYCLAICDTPEAKQAISIALKTLQYEGFGTDRTVGNGLFTLHIEDNVEIAHPKTTPTHYTNLGIFGTEDGNELQEMIGNQQTEKLSYEIIKRGGWISEPHTTYRKRSIYMFQAGGVWNTTSKLHTTSCVGSIFDLRPDILKGLHPIYRVGRTIFLPISIPS